MIQAFSLILKLAPALAVGSAGGADFHDDSTDRQQVQADIVSALSHASLQLHYNTSNLGEQLSDPRNARIAPWVVFLSPGTTDLEQCGRLCAQYQNGSGPFAFCQSFTRYAASVGSARPGDCYGHLDPIWLPLSGLNSSNGAVLADSGLVLRPCSTAFDCSHNGLCSAGTCECTQGWTGRRCQTLDLLPVDRSKLGFSPQDTARRNLSSWGGSVLSENGVWHMWAARMTNYCGIGQWEQNSEIVHATAEDVLGPYIEQGTVAPVFAHEPSVTRDPRTGELLMVSVNYPVDGQYSNQTIFNSSGICTCTANCTKAAVGSRNKCGMCRHPGSHPFLPIIRTAPRAEGPWSETLSTVLPSDDTNLACWINGTGAVNCNGRGGGVYAFSLDWRNFSSWEDFKLPGAPDAPMWVSSRPDDEDPMLWQDMATNVWHSIQHNLEGPHMCDGQLCQVGTHQFSIDGWQWYSTGTAYTNLVQYTDGTSHLFDRRERPHLIFAENTTNPVALATSARPGGLDGDRTFTLVQGLRTKAAV